MRRLFLASAAAIVAFSAPAFAQEQAVDPIVIADPAAVIPYAAVSAEGEPEGLSCPAGQFCDVDDEMDDAEDAVPTMAAPAIRGFRLAGPAPTAAAPNTRGFRLSGAPVMGTSRSPRLPRAPRGYASRRGGAAGYVAPRTAPAPGARADLMLSFLFNSDEMTPAAKSKARGFAKAMMTQDLAGKRFLIEGHSDSRGKRAVNVDLSRRRAQSVADYLVRQGVERTRVEVKGVGPDEPLPGRSPDAEANRRVEAVLLG